MSCRDIDNTPEWKRRRLKLPAEVEPLSFLSGPADKRATRVVADQVVGRRSSKKSQSKLVSASSSELALPSVSDCNTETEISSRSQSQDITEVLSYDRSQVSELPLSVASTCQGLASPLIPNAARERDANWMWLQQAIGDIARYDRIKAALVDSGVSCPGDFENLDAEEIVTIWPVLAELNKQQLTNIMLAAQAERLRTQRSGPTVVYERAETVDSNFLDKQMSVFAVAMAVLIKMRANAVVLSADDLCNALCRLASLSGHVVAHRWSRLFGEIPPELPKQRAAWLHSQTDQRKTLVRKMLEEDALWTELSQWRRSAAQYASAVRLWTTAANVIGAPPWPPSRIVLDTFTFFFKNGDSLCHYASHIKSVLRLLQMPTGVLEDSGGLLAGARKLTPLDCRRAKRRATGEQTRRLAVIVRKEFDRHDVADSWIVARQFCLRYQSEVIPMEGSGEHSKIVVTPGEVNKVKQVCLTLFNRKLQTEPVMITRRCICALQGKQLCGVCIVSTRLRDSSRLFPEVTYTGSLALLKASAALAGLMEPSSWGTHAFRRGWADEALQAGGPAALFFSGGWKGVAAFGYAQAKTRGALAAAEWLVDHSDSDNEE